MQIQKQKIILRYKSGILSLLGVVVLGLWGVSLAPKSVMAVPALGDVYTVQSGGVDRQYLLYVPRSYESSRPMPLVFFFHGGGGSMEQASRDYNMVSKAESAGFIVAFPNGTGPISGGGLATWNAGNCCDNARDNNIDDISFVRTVLGDIQSRYTIDPGRIFSTGCPMADFCPIVWPVK